MRGIFYFLEWLYIPHFYHFIHLFTIEFCRILIYHYLENFITKFKGANYNSWNTLNLSNFTYGSARSDLSYNRTYSEDAYFVNNYAQTSANEDRASTFEYMMFTNKASCLNANKPVWKKAKFMSQLLEKYLESVKPEVTEYWERHL